MMENRWDILSDSEGYILYDPNVETSSKELFEAYRQWCYDISYNRLSANRLISEFTQNEQLYHVTRANSIRLPDEKRMRGFLGVQAIARSQNFYNRT